MMAEPTNKTDAAIQAAEADQSLANLLEQMARELEERGTVDVEAIARSNPEHANRLRQFLPAMEAVAGWAERTAVFSAVNHATSQPPQLGDTVQYFGDYERGNSHLAT